MDLQAEMIRRIEDALPGAEIRLHDMTGTKDHWQAVIIAPGFAGMNRLKRQRTIYGALGELMLGTSAPIHALTMKTLTPEEAEKEDL